MEEENRRILNRNQVLLAKNIIITDEFYGYLRSYNVLPETMIKDIQAQKTRESRNNKLIELLQIRGCDSFRKLRHVLHLTGHTFLADHLHEEEKEIQFLKPEEVFGKYPSVFNQVSEDMRSKLLRFLESKVREKRLISAWEQTPTERSELQENRKGEFEMEKDLRMRLDKTTKQVSHIYEDLMKCKENLKKKEFEIETLKREMEEKKKKFKADLSVQAKFNAANNNCILKLNERFAAFNAKVKALNTKVLSFLDDIGEHADVREDSTRLSDLEINMMRLLNAVRESFDLASDTMRERRLILRLLNRSEHNRDPLSEVVKKYVDKDEKGRVALFHEIAKLSDVLHRNNTRRKGMPETTELKLLRNMVATVRVEVEHFQKKLNWKDDQISDLLEEMASLRRSRQGSVDNESLKKNTIRNNNNTALFKTAPVPDYQSASDSGFEIQFGYDNTDSSHNSGDIPRIAVHRCSSTDIKTENGVLENGEFIPRKVYSAGDRNAHYQTEDETPGENQAPRKITFCLHDDDKGMHSTARSTKTTTLPDIIDHENIRTESPWKHNRLNSFDLTSVLEQGDNNTELYKMTSLLAKKITENKLPSIFKMDLDVPSDVCDD